MLGWEISSQKRRRAVKSILTNRVNTRVIEERLNPDEHRSATRVSYLEPAVLVPREEDEWQFDRSFAVATHDISASGLSICHTAPMDGTYLITIHSDEHEPDHSGGCPPFFSATTRHCTPLDLGFWLVGLEAEESIELDRSQNEWLAARVAALRQAAADTERAFSSPG